MDGILARHAPALVGLWAPPYTAAKFDRTVRIGGFRPMARARGLGGPTGVCALLAAYGAPARAATSVLDASRGWISQIVLLSLAALMVLAAWQFAPEITSLAEPQATTGGAS